MQTFITTILILLLLTSSAFSQSQNDSTATADSTKDATARKIAQENKETIELLKQYINESYLDTVGYLYFYDNFQVQKDREVINRDSVKLSINNFDILINTNKDHIQLKEDTISLDIFTRNDTMIIKHKKDTLTTLRIHSIDNEEHKGHFFKPRAYERKINLKILNDNDSTDDYKLEYPIYDIRSNSTIPEQLDWLLLKVGGSTLKIRFREFKSKTRTYYRKSTHVEVNEDGILFVKIITHDYNTFSSGPINLKQENRLNKLEFYNKKEKETVKFYDVINWMPKSENVMYRPGKGNYDIEGFKSKLPLHKGVSLDHYLDVRIFTDALGLIGQADNGLVDTELSMPFPLFNDIIPSKKRRTYLKFLSRIEFNGRFSLLDSSSRYANIDTVSFINGTDTSSVFRVNNKLKVKQQSFLELSAQLNLIKWKVHNNTFEINGGFNYYLTDTRNTFTGDVGRISSSSLNLNFHYLLQAYTNYGLEVSGGYEWQYINDPKFFEARNDQRLVNIGIELFYNPKSNTQKRVFLRFMYSRAELTENPLYYYGTPNEVLANDAKNYQDQFVKFQIGYKTGIKIFSKK
ncbi:hypothetical protein [Flammeovirga aprica]|uniref:Outer membrane protein beta-barrel domain-containing protein n=1 Tax=Flammeovirga aprica JL-4 TaxID=694437 RepID=A0A7X9XB75_9BACT|nr:hypothetical protein [Flammeovirga aprica]NME70348.1 hypothetical protein [Flammeovirga aprica JL-4]